LPASIVIALAADELPVFSTSGFWTTGSFVRTGFEDESVLITGAGVEVVGWLIGRLEDVVTTLDRS
jgi:hypothetical protein